MADDPEPHEGEVSDGMSEYDEHDSHHKDEDDKMIDHKMSPDASQEGAAEVKKKYDPKDPHRPRRKKARRACYACQRAHLTCGKFVIEHQSYFWNLYMNMLLTTLFPSF